MLFIVFAFSAIALVFAHGAILAQFIGTTDATLMGLSVVQGLALLASLMVLLYFLRTQRDPIWQSSDPMGLRVRKVWRRLPSWMIFAIIIVVVNVLLGEISILIARVTGNELSVWQHTPTITIIIVSIICSIAAAACSGPRPSRDQYGPDSMH